MRDLHAVLQSIETAKGNGGIDVSIGHAIRAECAYVLGAARKRVARRLREIVEEFELLCLDDTDDRDYFKHVLMHPPVVMTPPQDATVVVSPGDISAACAWLLHDRMGIDVAELYEIFEELLVDR
jgi:hypothetical protein